MKTRYQDLDDRNGDLKRLMRGQKALARDFLEKLDVSLVYHENALEGVVLDCEELLTALDLAAVPAEASMVAVFTSIRNHRAALEFVREEAKDSKAAINLSLFKKLYELLGAGLEGKESAVFRKDMPPHRSYFHEIAPPEKVGPSLEALVAFTGTAEFRELHPLQQAAHVQWSFMKAFPFAHNSGKVARLLSNFILVRAGFLPVVMHSVDRQRYYESFRAPSSALRQLMVEAVQNSLANAFRFFEVPAMVRTSRAS